MNKTIQKIKKVRTFLLSQIGELTTEQFNKIPEGYNNNIIWNLAHLVCAQQSICYLRAAQPVIIDKKYITSFTTNTTPTEIINEQEIELVKKLFIDSIDQLQVDFDKKIFDHYTPSENILKIYGVSLLTIDDALEFILYHEGFHTGYIISLKHLVL